MKKNPSASFCLSIVVLALLGVGPGFALDPGAEPDEIPLSLRVEDWKFSPDMEVVVDEDDGGLRLTAPGTSAWAAPRGQWPVSKDLELTVEGDSEGGNIIVQVEWLDRAGGLVEPAEALRLSGNGLMDLKGKMEPPPTAASFGLKFWLEGQPPSTRILKVVMHRQPDWVSPAVVTMRVDSEKAKVEADAGLTCVGAGSGWRLALAEGTPFGSAHLDFRAAAEPGLRILYPILELPPQTAVSLQVLGWSAAGEFLGESKVLSDLSEPGDYEVTLPEVLDGISHFPAQISVKVWVSGPAEKPVRIGALRVAGPDL